MSNFVDCDRDQAFLLPPDLRDWIPADDLAHFVIEAVERVDLGAFKVNHRGTGSAQYHPRMMLALLIYCYANGIFSSRRIERATHRDIGVRFVAANRHPDLFPVSLWRPGPLPGVSRLGSSGLWRWLKALVVVGTRKWGWLSATDWRQARTSGRVPATSFRSRSRKAATAWH